VGAELFHRNRQTGKTKLIVAFRDSANAPNNAIKPDSSKIEDDGKCKINCAMKKETYKEIKILQDAVKY
jgi:hypothetical protein